MFHSYKCSVSICLFILALLFSIAVVIFALLFSREVPGQTSPGSRVSETLKFVVVVSRHGSRRALNSLPNQTIHWNYELGELTGLGRVQSYKLGVKIRSLYNGFLNPEYHSKDFHASSTSMDRAILSGQVFLAGLYPPMGNQVWNSELLWQPIPLYLDSPDVSPITKQLCPKFSEENTDSIKRFQEENKDRLSPIYDYLNKQGFNVTDPISFFKIFDVLFCEDVEGFPLPDWTKAVYPKPMVDLASEIFIAWCAGTPSMTRFSIGTFYKEIESVLMSKANGSFPPERQFQYYSGHDTTLVALQYLLGIPKESIVGLVRPGSAMIFELHQTSDGKFSVEVLFVDGGTTSLTPKVLVVPGCGSPCYLVNLMNITQQYTNISNFNEECKIS